MRCFSLLVMALVACVAVKAQDTPAASANNFISYTIDPAKHDLQLYWKDDSGHLFGSIQRLKDYLTRHHRTLLFATNGGMYQEDRSPVGLFIQQHKTVRKLNTRSASGNFYMKPNGVLFLTKDKKAAVCQTSAYKESKDIAFATQSGPMLVIDGKIHPDFKKGSVNINIRNGVGLLPGNKLLFVMSKWPVNFYDFAAFFQQQGCTNALYLDGFVSRTYLPALNWAQTDGNFGVIIAATTAQ